MLILNSLSKGWHKKLSKFCYYLSTRNRRYKHTSVILGIESSCDDTGAAVINENGNILGESLASQTAISVRFGGIMGKVSKCLHEENVDRVVTEAIEKANLLCKDVSAVAVTVEPGLPSSLSVGLTYAREFVHKYNIPLIPVHHMEAHALTARLNYQIEFPFLVLLISGGHCILSAAEDVDQWITFSQDTDEAPGKCLDRIARRLKLKNIAGFEEMSGGKALEKLAENGDRNRFPGPNVHSKFDFSFSGLRSFYEKLIVVLEEKHGIQGSIVLPEVEDICASAQYCLTSQLIDRTNRIMECIRQRDFLSKADYSFVISGGVACNKFIRNAFKSLCDLQEVPLFVPPSRLCTDNGVMVAWNGVEKWKKQIGILYDKADIEKLDIKHKSPLGRNVSSELLQMKLKKLPKCEF